MTFTKGPWKVFIDDTGDEWTGWPLSISQANDDEKTIVRTGGQWPYEWDEAMSKREAVANARLIAAAPEMFEVVEVIDQWHDHHAADAPEWRENDTVTVQLSIGDLRAARAALSRARGEA